MNELVTRPPGYYLTDMQLLQSLSEGGGGICGSTEREGTNDLHTLIHTHLLSWYIKGFKVQRKEFNKKISLASIGYCMDTIFLDGTSSQQNCMKF